jgi:integrase
LSADRHLKKRGETYFARLHVPLEAQQAVGKTELVRSLKTRDVVEARRRLIKALAVMQSEIDSAQASPIKGSAEVLLQQAQELRQQMEAGAITAREAEIAMDVALDLLLSKEARLRGVDDQGHPLLTPSEVATVNRAGNVVAGRRDTALAQLMEAHLSELKSDGVLRTSTRMEKERRVGDFVAWFGGNRSWQEVRRSVAVDYLKHLKGKEIGKEGSGERLSRSSLVKWLSDLRVFFRWILDNEDADTRPANPFDGLQPAKDVRGKLPAHRPWRDEEVSAMLAGIPDGDPLWPLTVLGAYSGARLDELASLKVADVDGDSFVVTEGKRQASVRRVPIHPAVAPMIARLLETSSDGFVIPGLRSGGYDDKRGFLIGKRFGYLRKKLRIGDERIVFHSLRNTVESKMLSRGVPLERAQLIVGHENLGSSTPYVDKGSVQDQANHQAMVLVTYGALDAHVAEAGPKLSVTVKAKARKLRK